MKLEKNPFYYFSVALSVIGLLYIIVCGFISLGAGQEYPYFPKGLLILGIFVIWILVWLAAALSARFRIEKKLAAGKKWIRYAEWLFVSVVLLLALLIRVYVVRTIPMQPASDYKTYYEIAQLLTDGTIQKNGKGYCDYVAMFPHVMGYCYLLMLAFKVFGVSVITGQYLNVFFAVATVFLTYKIARKLGGRIAGTAALLLCAFWPSQILYITMLSAEYSFTFFLFLCIYLFVSLVLHYNGNTKGSGKAIFLHLLLGVLIALTSAIRPMGLILLIAIVLTLLPQKMKLPPLPLNDIPLTVRFLERGWVRCVMIIIPYMIISGVISTNIELTVDRTLPSSATSFGYNLLVGLNTESKGGWNEEDAALLYDTMAETKSASQAHITCRDLAFQRLYNNPVGIFNLFIEKYELLWGNDDYGATWNIAFLEEQGELTKTRSGFLYGIRDINNIVYIVTIFFAMIALVYIWRSKANLASLLSLMFLGTAAMHLMVESQNRYHYFVLEIFMILAGMAVQFLFKDERLKRRISLIEEQAHSLKKQEESLTLEKIELVEEQVTELRKEALENVFDMKDALINGHIVMTVTQAYSEETEEESGQDKDALDEPDKEQADDTESVSESSQIAYHQGEENTETKVLPEENTETETEPAKEHYLKEDWGTKIEKPDEDWAADADRLKE